VRNLLVAAAVAVATVLVMAVVFRNRRALALVRQARNVLFIWVAVVIVLAVVEFFRRGGI
jgi:hypothetical protein